MRYNLNSAVRKKQSQEFAEFEVCSIKRRIQSNASPTTTVISIQRHTHCSSLFG